MWGVLIFCVYPLQAKELGEYFSGEHFNVSVCQYKHISLSSHYLIQQTLVELQSCLVTYILHSSPWC